MAVDEIVDVEELSVERWEFNGWIFELERFDELKVRVGEASQVDADQIQELLEHLLFFEAGWGGVVAVVLDVHAEQLDEALIIVVDAFLIG